VNVFFAFIFFLCGQFLHAADSDLEFKAQFYQRDNSRNTIKGRGSAWVKKGSRQVWADELEVDLKLNRVFARGNVHIKDSKVDIFCESGTYSLGGSEANLENVTLLFGQTVVSGTALNQLKEDEFELLDGVYTNCNTVPIIDKNTGQCPFDVKIYARKFSLRLDSYVHVFDGIVYAKELPLFYTPYFVAPAKTKRQSGVLVPSANYRQRLGTGFSIPIFLALGSWHDLTVTPTWWTQIGTHLDLDYRYIYSPTKKGRARFFLLEKSFNPALATPWIRVPGRRYLGLLSEAALDIHNEFSLGSRSHTRADLNWTSNNYWTQDFPSDFGALGDFQYLRNQLSFSFPNDSYLTVAAVKLNQSLINTLETGADRGSVAQLPDVRFYRKNQPLFTNFFFFEWDNRLTNFSRPHSAFDNVPMDRTQLNSDSQEGFDSNDYLRVGQRLIMERRLVGNAPLSPGIQFQPLVRAGLLAYHFDLPESQFKTQTYIDTEVPLALYLSRKFGMSDKDDQSVRHIIQPRILYGASLFRSKIPSHPFFSESPLPGFTSPRFDSMDFKEPFEYLRFEFNNRLMKKESGEARRFLLAQVSNNYYLKPSPLNNGEAGTGPIESYLDFQTGPFSAQVQGTYKLKAIKGVHENDWSATLSYSSSRGDRVSIATLLRKKADPTNNDETVVLSVYKTLPIYLDVFGSIEHSFRQATTRNYNIGFLFAAKPRNCWSLSFLSGRTVQNEHYARMVFGLSFGGI